jgi:hypothetical protein
LVIVTINLIHAPHRAFIRPISIRYDESKNEWKIKLKNYGPGVALDINVKNEELTGLIPMRGNRKKVWIELNILTGSGPYQLQPDQESEYSTGKSGLLTGVLKYPYFIKWRTITNKKQKSSWIFIKDAEEKFIPLRFIGYIAFYAKWTMVRMLSGPIKILKWWDLHK